jgi:hypothetical protein
VERLFQYGAEQADPVAEMGVAFWQKALLSYGFVSCESYDRNPVADVADQFFAERVSLQHVFESK